MVSREVYPPGDDSYLLEKAILAENLKGRMCLDLGCGSGIQSVALLRAGAADVLAVDINPSAIKATQGRVAEFINENKTRKLGHFFARNGNLFSPIKKEKFDFITFNPPYLPSDGVKWSDLDGGKDGRKVINRFLAQAAGHLAPKGVILLLVSSLNKPEEIERMFFENNFSVKVAAAKKLFFEELFVFKARKLF